MISTAAAVGAVNRAVAARRTTSATFCPQRPSKPLPSSSVKRRHLLHHHQDVLVGSRYYHGSCKMLDTDGGTVSHVIAAKNHHRRREQKRYQHHQSYQPIVAKEKEEEDPALTWARSNPAEAQACITPPPLSSFHHEHNDDSSYNSRYHSLEEYLKWRRWSLALNWKKWTGGSSNEDADTSKKPNRHDDDLNEQEQKTIHGYKMTMISHVLSTPLTLALQLEQYCRTMMNYKNSTSDDDEKFVVVPSTQVIKICCVGARAEASLPDMYWKELLNAVNTKPTTTSTSKPLSVSIDFIGPDIPPMMKERVVNSDSVDTDTESTLTLRGLYRGLFHDYFSTTDNARDANGENKGDDNNAGKTKIDDYNFILFFNPGFGHPNLQNGWDETLRTIFLIGDNDCANKKKAARRSRVLFFTAHSLIDADRDGKLLKENFGIDVKYTENPFASRIQYLDPYDKSTDDGENDLHIIRPNQYVALCIA
mmetsp:Transcript_37100/g.89929  ORF Transcript_37100/g.89929 Transcript_37100/m.89929 type:complete len:478 (+) Transcript_37100:73-1506(+)